MKRNLRTVQASADTASDTIQREAMVVTPEMAAAWLTRNTRNRHLNRGRVMQLVATIKAGRWRLTHQGIAFDVNGILLDGQHRLMAIVEAGIAVMLEVTFGLPVDTFYSIDSGETRRPGQILGLALGVGFGHREAAFIRALVMICRGGTLQNMHLDGEKLTEEALRHSDALEWAKSLPVGSDGSKRLISPVAAALAFFWPIDKPKIDDLARRLITGADLRQRSPELALRNYLSASRGRQGGAAAAASTILRVASAAQAFIEDAPRARVLESESALEWARRRRKQLGID
jgi:hypothetical protein